jgi:beta-glucosidase
MKFKELLIMAMTTAAALSSCSETDKVTYKDPTASVPARVEDLLGRMTLEEKVGQMNQFVGLEHIKANSAVMDESELKTNTANAFYPGFTYKDVEQWAEQGLIGSFLHVLTIEEANYLQGLAMKSRLQIPVIFGIDAIHGNALAPDNTIYPTNINLACSFDTLMARVIARQTAEEMRAMNMHWSFNPNVEVARDARWGRVGETFGEDPYLVTLLGVQTVKGYQRDLNSTEDVLACIKHFVGGSQPINGSNGAPADLSERTLREVFFPPFRAGVLAGAGSLMTAHNEVNGIPSHSNEWLMADVLRGEWNFPGFVVSDWMDIERLHDLHATASSLKEAFYQSIMAGMDMHMHGIHWNELVTELVKEGRIPEARIDESVRRILTMKFRLGLFEQPYADEAKSMQVRLSPEHRATSLEAARNGIVLLKNDGLLPLDASKYKRVLVTGINADSENIVGDWSASPSPENVITILEGLKQIAPETQFDFVDQGWDPRNMNPKKVDEAAAKARQADLNIVVAGEYMMRFRWTDRTDGEDTDRSDLDLVGLQNELIERVAASGKPTLLILVSGRPLGVEWAAEHLPAIIEAWAPGMYGGQAVAEILYGKVNPSAKLAVTIPHSVGQIQIYYNHKPSQYFHPYAAGKPVTPLYAFGHGLSYTTYQYEDLQLAQQEIDQHGAVDVRVKVTNTGSRDGVEIVQLYIRDVYSSASRPVKELKDFARVPLKAGESKVVTFRLTADKLAFYDKKMRWTVEPGEFKVMVGASSEEKDLLTASFVVK